MWSECRTCMLPIAAPKRHRSAARLVPDSVLIETLPSEKKREGPPNSFLLLAVWKPSWQNKEDGVVHWFVRDIYYGTAIWPRGANGKGDTLFSRPARQQRASSSSIPRRDRVGRQKLIEDENSSGITVRGFTRPIVWFGLICGLTWSEVPYGWTGRKICKFWIKKKVFYHYGKGKQKKTEAN